MSYTNYLDLRPQTTDPNVRLAQRLSALEERLNAMERKRDLIITPFQLTSTGAGSWPYHGGRVWILYGGAATAPVGDTTGGNYGYALTPDGLLPLMLALYNTVNSWAGRTIGLPTLVTQLYPDPSASVINYTLGLQERLAGGTFTCSGMLIEWPQA